MLNILKTAFFICVFSVVSQRLNADTLFNITLDTASLVGHPAGPFYVEFALTDGSGIGDANNTVTLSNFNLGGGSALGSPFLFGGASGSLATGVTITDTSFVSFFSEQFAPGLHLSFLLGLTSNDDAGGTPDGFTFFILDSSGVALPTLAPFGDYFLGAALGSTGPLFDAWGSDPSRAPTDGDPVSISAPIVTASSAVPEPGSIYLVASVVVVMALVRHRFRGVCREPRSEEH